MAYIGRDIEYGTFTKQVITPPDSSTTVYTLDQSVGNARNLIVSVGGVIQEPDVAFTAVGTNLTFTSAPAQGSAVWIVYLGKELGSGGSRTASINFQSENGNGTTTPFVLTKSVVNSASILVTLNGIAQVPDTDYTAANLVLTFSTAPSADMDIMVYYFDVAGKINTVPDGSITASSLAANGTWPAWNGSALTNLTSGNLSGSALPALNASNVTGLTDSLSTETTTDPLLNSNPASVGHMWLNTSTGELFCCTDNTTNNNVWKNIGEGSGNVSAPTNPTNTGTFTGNENGGTTFTFQFTGGVVASHYLVDNITGGALTVTTPEVADGASHEFVTTMPASGNDTVHTFRVRTKNAEGFYSSGITVSFTILAISYITATGGIYSTSGDYIYRTFTGNGTFTVSALGTTGNNTVDYLLVGGGGGGGSGRGGGGGAGGYVASSLTISTGSFEVEVGGGGDGSNNVPYTNEALIGKVGHSTSVTGLGITTATGGGGGGTCQWQGFPHLRNGASGGGAGGNNGYVGGTSTSQGNNGGGCTNSGGHGRSGGGGGGASVAGVAGHWPKAGDGGNGTTWINGTTYAGGGGGGTGSGVSNIGLAGTGGGGKGGWGYRSAPGQTGGENPDHGTQFTGGGGGGDGYENYNLQNGNGGDGVVIFRYKYQN